MLINWDEIIKDKQSNRVIRYIVTGNILQAFGNKALKGNLISYTTIDKSVKKGILLPEDFTTEVKLSSEEELRITVPIIKALPIIKSMLHNRSIATTDDLLITRRNQWNDDDYVVSVPSNKNKGGKFFLDSTINQMSVEGKFNTKSGRMIAHFNTNKIDDLVEYLQLKFKCSVNLVKQEFDRIKDSIEDVVYDDEKKKPQSDVFIEKLTEIDKRDEEFFAKEKDAKSMEEELAFGNEQRVLEIKKKLFNLLKMLN
jgi:hypothetical protein